MSPDVPRYCLTIISLPLWDRLLLGRLADRRESCKLRSWTSLRHSSSIKFCSGFLLAFPICSPVKLHSISGIAETAFICLRPRHSSPSMYRPFTRGNGRCLFCIDKARRIQSPRSIVHTEVCLCPHALAHFDFHGVSEYLEGGTSCPNRYPTQLWI